MPLPYVLPGRPTRAVGAGLDGASTGAKLTYTAPAGKPALVMGAAVSGLGATTDVNLTVTAGAVTAMVYYNGAAGADWSNHNMMIPLEAGDSVSLRVVDITALDTFDGHIGILEAP